MNIEEFKAKCQDKEPCEQGWDAFMRCRNRREVFELLSSPIACDFLLDSIEEGWGPEPRDMERIFRPFLNGGITNVFATELRKVKSQVWCRADEVEIEDDIRWLILIGCRGTVRIKDWQVVKIFVDAYSSVEIDAAPNAVVYVENRGGRVKSVKGNCKYKINGRD